MTELIAPRPPLQIPKYPNTLIPRNAVIVHCRSPAQQPNPSHKKEMEETQGGRSQSIEDQEVTSRDLPPEEEHGSEDLSKRKKYELKLMRKFDK